MMHEQTAWRGPFREPDGPNMPRFGGTVNLQNTQKREREREQKEGERESWRWGEGEMVASE